MRQLIEGMELESVLGQSYASEAVQVGRNGRCLGLTAPVFT
jgi:hypothetical protein